MKGEYLVSYVGRSHIVVKSRKTIIDGFFFWLTFSLRILKTIKKKKFY